jgi:hypothetical protein
MTYEVCILSLFSIANLSLLTPEKNSFPTSSDRNNFLESIFSNNTCKLTPGNPSILARCALRLTPSHSSGDKKKFIQSRIRKNIVYKCDKGLQTFFLKYQKYVYCICNVNVCFEVRVYP